LNGSPRKDWNTAALLAEALKGARSQGAETELIHLYDLSFKGCVSCFACKTKENYRSGKCAQKDDLAPVLELAARSSGLVIGSPIYIGDVTASVRAFLERFVFKNLAYDAEEPLAGPPIPALGLVYTMNIPAESLEPYGYTSMFSAHKQIFSRLKPPLLEQLFCCDTLQFRDYSRFHAPMFNEAHKREVREREFPGDLKKAFDLGVRLALQP
jgi:multimeric flavodoxin WrbA